MAQTLARGLRYRREDTVMHRLDPLIKLLLSIVLLFFSFLSSNPYQLAVVGVAIAILVVMAKVVRRTGKLVLMSLGLGAFIFIASWLSHISLLDDITLFARFLAVMASVSLFFITTSPDELEQVMKWFRFPRDFVFAFVTAVRFVPVLLLDLTQIIDAQKSRGLELDRGNPVRRVRNFVPVLIPMVVNAMVRSDELAEALEARGFGVVSKATSMYSMKFSGRDYQALGAIVASSLCMLVIMGKL